MQSIWDLVREKQSEFSVRSSKRFAGLREDDVKSAMQLYADGVEYCSAHGVSYSEIRVNVGRGTQIHTHLPAMLRITSAVLRFDGQRWVVRQEWAPATGAKSWTAWWGSVRVKRKIVRVVS